MNMMHRGCRCFHHVFGAVVSVLAGLSAVGFFVVLFRQATLFGWSVDAYFMSAIMLVIIARTGKVCRCCHSGMGMKMGMEKSPIVCDHQNCSCGNCDHCK